MERKHWKHLSAVSKNLAPSRETGLLYFHINFFKQPTKHVYLELSFSNKNENKNFESFLKLNTTLVGRDLAGKPIPEISQQNELSSAQ